MDHAGQELPPLAEPWIQTPGFLQDRAVRLHTAMLDFNSVVDELVKNKSLKTDTAKYKQWKHFIADYGRWFKETSWMWSATAATLERYERDFQGWVRWARQTFPAATPDLPTAPRPFGPDGPRDEISPLLIAVAVGAGAFVLFKLLR